MVRQILKWTNDKYEEVLYYNQDEKHPLAKAAGLGVLEGMIDGFVIVGAIEFITGAVRIGKYLVTKKHK